MSAHSQPAHGTVTYNAASGAFEYTLTDPDFKCGTDSFKYVASDKLWLAGRPASATVRVTLLGDGECVLLTKGVSAFAN